MRIWSLCYSATSRFLKEFARLPISGPVFICLNVAYANALADVVLKFRCRERRRHPQHDAFARAAKHRRFPVGVFDESSKFGECREVTIEKHRYNRYLPLLGKGLKLIERGEIAVYVTERESAKGPILRNRPVSDAMHTVYILAVKKMSGSLTFHAWCFRTMPIHLPLLGTDVLRAYTSPP